MNSKTKPNAPRDEKFGAHAIRNIVSTNAIVTSLRTSVRLDRAFIFGIRNLAKAGAAGDRGSFRYLFEDSRQFRRQ
jgi:hypothetical protein